MTPSSQQGSDSTRWSLQTPGGKSNIRIASGLVIGEDERGHFEIGPADEHGALIRFEVEGRVVYIHSVSRDWVLACRDRMVGDSFRSERTVELHLPNNVFRVVGGEDPAAEPTRLELSRRPSVNWLRPAPQRTDNRRADTAKIRAVRPTEDIEKPQVGRFPEGLLGDPANTTVARAPRRTGPDEQTIAVDPADRHIQSTGARRQPVLSPLVAGLIGLAGGIGVALLYPALREDRVPEPSGSVDARPAPQTTPPQEASAVARSSIQAADAPPSAVPFPPLPQTLPAEDALPTTEPDDREEVAEGPVERLPEPEPADTPAIEPVVLPPVERRLMPPVAQTAAQTAGAAEAAAGPETIDDQPDSTVVAELEEIGLMAQAVATDLTRRRDLLAADLALAQGRLMSPPEASAYMLYNRVLAVDPGSPEAGIGLQSVRQELINRTLAQLAGDDLDDARRTLQAAADAGANPLLIADLRAEIDYRQQLTDPR